MDSSASKGMDVPFQMLSGIPERTDEVDHDCHVAIARVSKWNYPDLFVLRHQIIEWLRSSIFLSDIKGDFS